MTTPPQTSSELDKAVEEVFNWNNHHLTAARPSRQAVDQLLLAAKRLKEVENSLETEKLLVKGLEGNLKACEEMLKEVEKERDTIINRTPEAIHILLESQAEELSTLRTEYEFVKQERDLILSKTDTMDLDHKRMLGMSLEMNKLRTEYKKALEALNNGLLSLRYVVTALHANNAISPDARVAINQMKEVLSSPHAIAAMKKGEV